MTDPAPTEHPPHPPVFRTVFKARLILLGTGLLANILILTELVGVIPGVIAFALSVGLYALLSTYYWKCPHCRKYPGNAVMPDYCEKCGKPIFGVDAQVPPRPPGAALLPLRYIVLGRALYGVLLLVFFVVFGPHQSSSPYVFWLSAVGFILFGAWFEWRWWRCPNCGGYLKRSMWPGRSCTKCGEQLRY